MITVVAQYQLKPEHVDQARELLVRHARESRSESGCCHFAVHQAQEDPTRFLLYEGYGDHDAFESHRRSAHFAENIERGITPLLAAREFRIYGPAL